MSFEFSLTGIQLNALQGKSEEGDNDQLRRIATLFKAIHPEIEKVLAERATPDLSGLLELCDRKEDVILLWNTLGKNIDKIRSADLWIPSRYAKEISTELIDPRIANFEKLKERFDKLLQVLEAIFTEKIENPSLIKKFAVFKEKAKSLHQKHNEYVHSQWLFAEDDSYVGRMRNLKFLRIEHEVRPPVGRLSKLADDLSSCAGELYSFIFEVKMIVEREKAT